MLRRAYPVDFPDRDELRRTHEKIFNDFRSRYQKEPAAKVSAPEAEQKSVYSGISSYESYHYSGTSGSRVPSEVSEPGCDSNYSEAFTPNFVPYENLTVSTAEANAKFSDEEMLRIINERYGISSEPPTKRQRFA